MKIMILRHAEPVLPPLKKISADGFLDWVDLYNIAQLNPSSRPSTALKEIINQCNAIVCSELPRSIASAKIFNSKKIVLIDRVFNEVGMPSANWQTLKLSPKLWAVFFRMLWLIGYSKYSESFKSAKYRAEIAVNQLIDLSKIHDEVIIVGHGIFNRLLVKELLKKGWNGPKKPSSQYWGSSIYESND